MALQGKQSQNNGNGWAFGSPPTPGVPQAQQVQITSMIN